MFETNTVNEVLWQGFVDLPFQALHAIRTVVSSTFVMFITINYQVIDVP